MYKFLVDMFIIIMDTYLRVEMLGHMVTLFNCLRKCQTSLRVPISLHPNQHLLLSLFYSSHPSGHKMLLGFLFAFP